MAKPYNLFPSLGGMIRVTVETVSGRRKVDMSSYILSESCFITLDDETTVKCYPYRTAKVRTIFMQVNPEQDSEFDQFVDTLFAKSGAHKDNHVTFEVTCEDSSYVIMYSDNVLYIGFGVTKKIW